MATDLAAATLATAPDLAGRTAIVTGASRGIGATITSRLIASGVDVVALARDPDGLAALDARLAGSGGQLVCRTGDVRDDETLTDLVARTVARFGGIDLVVSNAGGVPEGVAGSAPSQQLVEAIRLNTGPTLDLVGAARDHLVASGHGSVVVIGSVASRSADVKNPAYAASKAALDHLVRVLAHDLAPHVRVNAVVPGPIVTDAFEAWVASRHETLEEHAGDIPLRRLGTVDDVAAAVEFFAGDRSSWITGQLLEVDGGTTSTR